MITNIKILLIRGKLLISFNEDSLLVLANKNVKYNLRINAVVMGVINDQIVILIKNKYIAILSFPNFSLVKVLTKCKVLNHTHAKDIIWFQTENKVFSIDISHNIKMHDEFDGNLVKFIFLNSANSLLFVVKDSIGIRFLFESSNISSFCLERVKSTPEFFFESATDILFFLGRSLVEYSFQKKIIKSNKTQEVIKCFWKDIIINIEYEIFSTKIAFTGACKRDILINGDLFKIISLEDDLYFFSDSINFSLIIHKINSEGQSELIYSQNGSDFNVKFEKSINEHLCPMLSAYPKTNLLAGKSELTAIFYIHGGPHQKSGNSWDYLIAELLHEKYKVYIPQYTGTLGCKMDLEYSDYGKKDFEDIILQYLNLRKIYKKIIILGHSYGAFLGFKLFCSLSDVILIGLNGIYDLVTASQLNPKTYAHISLEILEERSCALSDKLRNFDYWHHIHFTNDYIVKKEYLDLSLERVSSVRPRMHSLDFFGHGFFNELQSKKIVEKIKSIEQSIYAKGLCWMEDEKKY